MLMECMQFPQTSLQHEILDTMKGQLPPLDAQGTQADLSECPGLCGPALASALCLFALTYDRCTL